MDFFSTNSWLAMFSGFNIQPTYYHPAVDDFDEQLVEKELKAIAASIANTVKDLPDHLSFIKRNIALEQ
ncbi:MAG TPA: hypothetical protein DIW64_15105 [Cellvibrio sp.]|nr:hypothetical protein [Cellvibrio sp.]